MQIVEQVHNTLKHKETLKLKTLFEIIVTLKSITNKDKQNMQKYR